MSLFQEMEKYGLAYCEFNNKLLKQSNNKYMLFLATYQSMMFKQSIKKERL